ncbi:hypothetical protein ACJQWK_00302 [Exserohilum turcicum]|uniref:Uncharacterized protein n=1 Tax=Exserohilum turcicum (strain 28A) TaxID=671987 RepID=R0JPR8_EXST2|nr:uncharacterized protein SETTUDRAFT_164592 [Exserohilum turcica Et28A]EOA83138.1 hypothetical protein SETTUDRAFT_164592 [Exserohilum turcica Et28A]
MSASTATTPRNSTEELKSCVLLSASASTNAPKPESSLKESSKTRSLWSLIKQRARQHHDSLNVAYAAYYGQGAHTNGYANGKKQEIWQYQRGGGS